MIDLTGVTTEPSRPVRRGFTSAGTSIEVASPRPELSSPEPASLEEAIA
ncbi:hypothetical protein LWP59_01865 [Amycolatopsis acidiphila]|nr:hypothetical protein [Amycolatopsis acidiphila]UIJ60465.1 hypothetical protein LWP59_01865 [Amycolatopsis acidiphila]GHG82747.1 hypothetical protein GCM10017788_53530 [Amycolatopsis acidiphila]